MSWTISLGTLMDAASSGPISRSEVYQQAKCGVADLCCVCRPQFNRVWRLARRIGLIVPASRRKFALRGWDETVADELEVSS